MTNRELYRYVGRHSRLSMDQLIVKLKREGYRVPKSKVFRACFAWVLKAGSKSMG